MDKRVLAIGFALLVVSVIFFAFAIQGAESVTPPRSDPLARYRFRVEIDGITIASFKEVEGLNVTVEVIEFRQAGDVSSAPILLPGLINYGPLVLRDGITTNAELWLWMKQVVDGDMDSARRNMSVIIQDSEGMDKVRYNLQDAWPSGYSVDSLDGLGTSVAIEELVIQYEKLTRETS